MVTLLTLLVSFHWVELPKRLMEQHSPIILYKDGQVAHITLAPDERWRTKVHVDNIDPAYIQALLTIEDKRFYWHPGFDPISISRALIQNMLSGTIVSGASTLTMQLIRLVEPRPRTYHSKIIEVWRSMQLEWHFNKDEILGMYLSFIPFGGNVEGVEAASLQLFGRMPVHLEAHQIALLIAIPQNPNARSASLENNIRLQTARDHIAKLLLQQGALPIEKNQTVQSIYSKSVPFAKLPFPRDLPHLVDQLGTSLHSTPRLQTTLDKSIQQTLIEIVKSRQIGYQRQGIYNAAGVIADRNSGEIRGLLGNFDYWSGTHASTIASYSTPRSAGSTLKPFIFAQAIDLGLATPARMMEDIPQNFRGYRPRNYGAVYHGLVSLSESLSQSYNIPFVQLLSEIGMTPFLELMNELGIHHFSKYRDRLGLSVAVGLELTPIELTQAYTTLANKGQTLELSLFDPLERTTDLYNQRILGKGPLGNDPFSKASSWLVGQSLRKRDRPDFPNRYEYIGRQRPFAWKTGTSFGFHDAWTVGWGDQYVTTIWFGNLDYRSSVHLIGSQAAGTVFFEIMERIEKPFSTEDKPDDVVSIEVCSQTGFLPNPACTETRFTEGRKERVTTKICEQHRHILLNEDGVRVTPQCSENALNRKSVWVPSIEYQRWSKLPAPIPPLDPDCSLAGIDSSLSIHSPDPTNRVILLPDQNNQNIELIANYDDPHALLYWFVNDNFIGQFTSSERVWWTPTEGTHTIAVEDGHSNTDRIQIQVDTFSN